MSSLALGLTASPIITTPIAYTGLSTNNPQSVSVYEVPYNSAINGQIVVTVDHPTLPASASQWARVTLDSQYLAFKFTPAPSIGGSSLLCIPISYYNNNTFGSLTLRFVYYIVNPSTAVTWGISAYFSGTLLSNKVNA